MRAFACLGAALAAATVAGHPICFIGDRPPDLAQTLTFCPAPQDGACCTDAEELQVKARFDAAGSLSNDCADLWKQVQCGQCHSYSGHLFADLGSELGVEDGMTMKSDFCEDLVDECDGEIEFPTYDGGGTTYCEKHTGDQDNDFFWSYPYEEPELFEPGLNEVFPDLDDDDFPDQVLSMHQSPDGSMFWLGGQLGVIKKVDVDDMDSSSTVLDISGGDITTSLEEGILDFAFGPLFGVPGYPDYFYVSYTVQLDGEDQARNRLSRFEYFSGSQSATLDSEDILITTEPKSTPIHAAGWCGFKPSAYGDEADYHEIYWSTGDGGPQEDDELNGQESTNLLSAMIRISVPSDGTGYEIPGGNYGGTARPEICAFGFRNPWRCSFDRANDDLWCGDVGQISVEEINIVECGKNYGWSRFEGSRCQEGAREETFGTCAGATRSGFEFPAFQYCHPDYDDGDDDEQEFTNGVDICGDRAVTGSAVIGGYRYRGAAFEDLLGGAYIFADNVDRNVYYLTPNGVGWEVGYIISDKSVRVIGFSEDVMGELMVITHDYKIFYLPCGDLCFERTPALDVGAYLGCFADADGGGRVMEFAAVSDDMDAETCAKLCEDQPYFGTQYGEECWCGDASTDFTQHGDGVCETPCTGNNQEICGGSYAITAYAQNDDAVEPPPAPTPSTLTGVSYVGCFSDPKGTVRLMPTKVAVDPFGMTPEACSLLCSGSTFFGTQYSEECWCTNEASPDLDANGSGVCDYPCTGDSSEICGGYYAISAYQHVDIDDTDESDDGTDDGNDSPSPSTPTGISYVGCFSDPKGNVRLMPTKAAVDPSGMTTEVCSQLCSGSPFFGTQYSEECWCTNEASPDLDANGSGVCDYPCTGDSSEICGGYYAISAYQHVDIDDTDDGNDSPSPSTPTGISYVGCFSDPKGNVRLMPTKAAVDPSGMTTEVCSQLCSGSPFFGTQYSEECWCTNEASPDLDANGPGTCDYPCSGDSDDTCGGYYAISVYQHVGVDGDSADDSPSPSTSTEASYVGCFSDPKGSVRLMPTKAAVDPSGMTTEVCSQLCSGSSFFGTQYSEECWCTNEASPDLDAYGEGVCDYPCSGDGDQTCGGYYAISVYEL